MAVFLRIVGTGFVDAGQAGFPFSKRPESERKVNRHVIGHLLERAGAD